MVRIELELPDKSDWVKVFDPRDCTIYVASEEPPPVGESIRIDLVVGDAGPRVILRGEVISSRREPDGSLPAGANVALGPEEREKVNYLNAFVRGGMVNKRERRRLPLRLRVTYQVADDICESYTRDINEEGVFVVTEDPLPEDSQLTLALTIPGREATLSVDGRVTHTVVVEDEDVPGMGILFDLQGDEHAELRELIDELERKFLASELPEDCLL